MTMIDKDVKSYFDKEMQDYIEPINTISQPETKPDGKSKPPLVNIFAPIYNFDKICKKIYKNQPKSADGIFFCKNTMYVVEFKTGFKKNPKNKSEGLNFLCTKHNEVCEEQKKWQDDAFKRKQNELKTSVRLKAIESYITLEKQLIPLCDDTEIKCRLVFVVVTDADCVNVYDRELGQLGKKHISASTASNVLIQLKTSLNSYNLKHDKHASSNDYFYDEIKVMSSEEFENFFNKLSPEKINPPSSEYQPVL